MRYPAAETAIKHKRILREAARLFRERGFDRAGVAEIMNAASLTHGAFYAHFASKEALAAEASSDAAAEVLRQIELACASAHPIRSFSEKYLSTRHRDSPGQGCGWAALGSELARQPDSVRGAVTEELRKVFDALATSLPWSKGTNPRQEAIRLLATLLGAMILSRAVNDRALSSEILEAVKTGYAAGSRKRGGSCRRKGEKRRVR